MREQAGYMMKRLEGDGRDVVSEILGAGRRGNAHGHRRSRQIALQ